MMADCFARLPPPSGDYPPWREDRRRSRWDSLARNVRHERVCRRGEPLGIDEDGRNGLAVPQGHPREQVADAANLGPVVPDFTQHEKDVDVGIWCGLSPRIGAEEANVDEIGAVQILQ